MPATRSLSQADRLCKALAHPQRRELLQMLSDVDDLSPKRTSDQIGVRPENLSFHFRALEDLGLARIARETRARGAVEHHYELTADGRAAQPVLAALTTLDS